MVCDRFKEEETRPEPISTRFMVQIEYWEKDTVTEYFDNFVMAINFASQNSDGQRMVTIDELNTYGSEHDSVEEGRVIRCKEYDEDGSEL